MHRSKVSKRGISRTTPAGQQRCSLGMLEPLEARLLLSDVSFIAAHCFAAPGTSAVVAGDFNGDGKSDLALANAVGRSLSVLLGDGFSILSPAGNLYLGWIPGSLAAADFNADGRSDLAVGSFDGVRILLSDGSGSFAPGGSFAAGERPGPLTVADLNGDGRSDLIAVNQRSDSVSILLGDGSGGFAPATSFAVGNYPCSVAVSDFNGDAAADLAVLIDSGIDILPGDGLGSFGAPSYLSAASLESVIVGDFNGDGLSDLAGPDTGIDGVTIFLSTGTGAFASPIGFALGGITSGHHVAVADFDGDGRSDMALGSHSSGTISIIMGSDTGSFRIAARLAAGWSPNVLSVGDFNGDAIIDLAALNPPQSEIGESSVSILPGLGGGAFLAADSVLVEPSPISVASGDFDSDGRADIAVAETTGTTGGVTVLLNDGGAKLRNTGNITAGGSPREVVVGDFNADGHNDLAVAHWEDFGVSILLGDGAGSFGSPIACGVGYVARGLAVGDFNSDGIDDLAAGDLSWHAVWVVPGCLSGSFSAGPRINVGGMVKSVAVGDFNGDGKDDLVTANGSSRSVSILLGDGQGSFGLPASLAVLAEAVAVGDFNGDGRSDLVVTGGHMTVLLGDGSGSFAVGGAFAAGPGPGPIVVGDFDADGWSDVAVANHYVSVLMGRGDGSFAPAVNFAAAGRPAGLILVDLDGDGRSDLATADNGSDSVSILLNNTDIPADFNGDGRITGQDFLVWQAHYPMLSGAARADGDANGDGKVNGQDFLAWQAAYRPLGAAIGSAAVGTIDVVQEMAAASQVPALDVAPAVAEVLGDQPAMAFVGGGLGAEQAGTVEVLGAEALKGAAPVGEPGQPVLLAVVKQVLQGGQVQPVHVIDAERQGSAIRGGYHSSNGALPREWQEVLWLPDYRFSVLPAVFARDPLTRPF